MVSSLFLPSAYNGDETGVLCASRAGCLETVVLVLGKSSNALPNDDRTYLPRQILCGSPLKLAFLNWGMR